MGLKKSKQQIYLVQDEIRSGAYFEDLSNEVIYELFDYLSYRDINSTFGELNERFRSLVNTYAHYVNLQQHSQSDKQLLPQNISALKINARYQLAFVDFSKISSLYALIVSNIAVNELYDLLNILSLKELEYVYIGPYATYYGSGTEKLPQVQEKILSLGALRLNKCVFRTNLSVDVDMLPTSLPCLEYLRIDGCKNISVVNNLLDRMPNLKTLHVSVCESWEPNHTAVWHMKRVKHDPLKTLTIRLYESGTIEEYMPLFTRYCSNLNKLVVHLSHARMSEASKPTIDTSLINQYQSIKSIINRLLRKLTSFHLRQRLSMQNYEIFFNLPQRFASCVKEVPASSKHQSYQIFVPPHLEQLYQCVDET